MWEFEILREKLEKRGVIFKKTPYGGIIAAKINTKENYQLFKDYCSAAYTSPCSNMPRAELVGNFEGPDWYFIEGHDKDEYGQYTWHLESLTYKKNRFVKFLEEYEV